VSSGAKATNTYHEVYDRSIRQPEDFWAEEAKRVEWMKPWSKVLDNSNPPFTKWYFPISFVFDIFPPVTIMYLPA